MTVIRTSDTKSWQEAYSTYRTYGRDPYLHPFHEHSPWNLPISNSATFEAPTDANTTAVRSNSATTWINQPSYSSNIYQAEHGDAYFDVNNFATIRAKSTFTEGAGSDKHLVITDPNKGYAYDMWHASWPTSTTLTADKLRVTDMYGQGIGPMDGVRAAGTSVLAGMIRAWEVDSTHPAYTGAINHAVALACDPSLFTYISGTPGYDNSGYGRQLGYVWPATEQDWSSSTAYTGVVPFGTYVAIPPSTDIGTLGLSAEGLMLAKTMQDYGGYFVDVTSAAFAWFVETDAPTGFRDALLAGNASSDLNKIRQELCVVTNNAELTPNGGGLGDPRRQAITAPLIVKPEYQS